METSHYYIIVRDDEDRTKMLSSFLSEAACFAWRWCDPITMVCGTCGRCISSGFVSTAASLAGVTTPSRSSDDTEIISVDGDSAVTRRNGGTVSVSPALTMAIVHVLFVVFSFATVCVLGSNDRFASAVVGFPPWFGGCRSGEGPCVRDVLVGRASFGLAAFHASNALMAGVLSLRAGVIVDPATAQRATAGRIAFALARVATAFGLAAYVDDWTMVLWSRVVVVPACVYAAWRISTALGFGRTLVNRFAMSEDESRAAKASAWTTVAGYAGALAIAVSAYFFCIHDPFRDGLPIALACAWFASTIVLSMGSTAEEVQDARPSTGLLTAAMGTLHSAVLFADAVSTAVSADPEPWPTRVWPITALCLIVFGGELVVDELSRVENEKTVHDVSMFGLVSYLHVTLVSWRVLGLADGGTLLYGTWTKPVEFAKITTLAAALLLHAWYLVAPCLLPDRDFGD